MVTLLGCVLAVLLTAGQLPPKEGRIESVKDEKANFASFTTYRWEKAYEAYDKAVHQLIVNTIDAEMAARGFKKIEGDSASVSIRYFTVVRTDVMLDKLDEYEKKGLPAPTKTLGRLAIVMRDAANNRVWAADTVQPLKNEPATRDAEIRQVIGKMFETYPKK
jgi:hypothetical protein